MVVEKIRKKTFVVAIDLTKSHFNSFAQLVALTAKETQTLHQGQPPNRLSLFVGLLYMENGGWFPLRFLSPHFLSLSQRSTEK